MFEATPDCGYACLGPPLALLWHKAYFTYFVSVNRKPAHAGRAIKRGKILTHMPLTTMANCGKTRQATPPAMSGATDVLLLRSRLG